MALFGGSKSTSVTNQLQETNSQNIDTSGVLANAPVISGSNNSLTQEFSGSVASAFGDLTNLVSKSIGITDQTATNALSTLSKINENQQAPENIGLSKLIPLGLVAIAGFTVIKIFGK